MHFLFIPFGTAGDVHPFIGVAIALRQRGHRVTVLADSAFETAILAGGLEFESLPRPEDHAALLKHLDLWHPTRSYPLIFKRVVAPQIRPIYEFIRDAYVPGGTVVVAANLALGARVACEQFGIPMVSLYVSPMCFRSYSHPPALPALNLFPGRPRTWVRALFRIADWKVGGILAPSLNGLCREVGLPPVRKIMDWWHSPQIVIGLFPEWFAPMEPEWPPQTQLTGFPLYDTAGPTAIPPELEVFLESGPPPVVFMPSSSMAQGATFLKESIAACELLQCRGVLLTQFPDQVPAPLPPGICSFRFVPLSRLLPRSAAIVHHAGLGTIALALAAGVPQLAVPTAMDQLANAERLQPLGVATVMKTQEYRAERVATEIKNLMTSERVRKSCRDIAQRFIPNQAVDAAGDLIESFAARSD
jgi:rhamnosyltransferase subunit B